MRGERPPAEVFHLDRVMREEVQMLCHGVVTTDRSIMTSTDAPVAKNGPASGQAGQVEHLTMAERAARGKAERKLVPRRGPGEC